MGWEFRYLESIADAHEAFVLYHWHVPLRFGPRSLGERYRTNSSTVSGTVVAVCSGQEQRTQPQQVMAWEGGGSSYVDCRPDRGADDWEERWDLPESLECGVQLPDLLCFVHDNHVVPRVLCRRPALRSGAATGS